MPDLVYRAVGQRVNAEIALDRIEVDGHGNKGVGRHADIVPDGRSLVISPSMPASTRTPLRYRVAMPEPHSHEFHVTMDIPALRDRPVLDLVFPAWTPGSYMVRDFSRHVYDLRIASNGHTLPCERLDKLRWRVQAGGRPVQVSYRVFAFEQGVRTSFLDQDRAFLIGTSLFFLVEGEETRPCLLDLEPPAGWRISTALPALRGAGHRFSAHGYDELVDEPVEVGNHRLYAFRKGGTRFEVTIAGPTNAEIPRLIGDLRRIVDATGALFGGFPFDRYLFIIHALPERGGGLEHACSSTLDIAGMAFEDEKAYQRFDELAAHEFFHAWNVKRICDRVLGPFDYTAENYTRLLWFHEGFTEYMQSIILLRAGLLTPEHHLKDLGEDWARYAGRPGRNITPLPELSFEAWIKQYKPADNFANRAVSYYEKGKWAALLLDLILRRASKGRRGLPHVFRKLWQSHGRRGRPITAGDIRAAAESVGRCSLGWYFSRYVDGTAELPVPRWLQRTGILAAARSPAQTERDDKVKARRQQAWAGLSFASGEGAVVKNVIPDSPAWRAGLTFRDEIVAVNHNRVDASTAGKRLADCSPGQAVTVAFFRQGILRTTSLRLVRTPERKWSFAIDPVASPARRRVRDGWLRGF
jgi:predicted metalloprotease with PDZ domain